MLVAALPKAMWCFKMRALHHSRQVSNSLTVEIQLHKKSAKSSDFKRLFPSTLIAVLLLLEKAENRMTSNEVAVQRGVIRAMPPKGQSPGANISFDPPQTEAGPPGPAWAPS